MTILRYSTSDSQQQLPTQPTTNQPNLLSEISQPFRIAGQGLMDLGMLGGYGIDKYILGNPNADQTLARVNQPLITSQESQQYSNPLLSGQTALNIGKEAAGLGSWALPLGKGPLLAKLGIGALQGGLQGFSQPNSTLGSTGTSAGVGAALNTLIPGGAGLLKLTGTGIKKVAGQSADIAKEFAIRKSQPFIENIQSFLGKRALQQTGGESTIHPYAEQMLEKYGLVLPPNGDAQVFESRLGQVSNQVESQIKPILEKLSIPFNDISSAVRDTVKNFGLTRNPTALNNLLAQAEGALNSNVDKFGAKGVHFVNDLKGNTLKILTGTRDIGSTENIDLYKLKQMRSSLGSQLEWDRNAASFNDITNKAGRDLYNRLGSIIDKQVQNPQYKELMKESEFLIHAKDATSHTLGGFSKLPQSATSETIAKSNALRAFLGPERLKQAALRAGLLGATAGGTALGLPKEITLPLMALEAASLIPYGGEGLASGASNIESKIGDILQGPSNQIQKPVGQTILRALQQLGVGASTTGNQK